MNTVKELLIIRSVSFQQLDTNILEIKKMFPEHRISILTHAHGDRPAQKYKMVENIYIYHYHKAFKVTRRAKELNQKVFDVVIVPVSNITGAGFLNVILFSFTIKARRRLLCNLISAIYRLSFGKIIWMCLKNMAISAVAALLTLIAAIPVAFILLVKLKSLTLTKPKE